MKPYVKINGKSPYNDWEEGDSGIVDGYVFNGNLPFAVVINCRTKKFMFVEVWRLEFVTYGQTQENMSGAI